MTLNIGAKEVVGGAGRTTPGVSGGSSDGGANGSTTSARAASSGKTTLASSRAASVSVGHSSSSGQGSASKTATASGATAGKGIAGTGSGATADAPAASATATKSIKKGLGFNTTSYVTAFDEYISWSYNWDSTVEGLAGGMQYYPMMHYEADAGPFPSAASAAVASGTTDHLLFVNEPD